jgi:hypothetical protein
MDVIVSPTLFPISMWTSADIRRWLAATIGCVYAYGLPLRLRPASMPTACLYATLLKIFYTQDLKVFLRKIQKSFYNIIFLCINQT